MNSNESTAPLIKLKGVGKSYQHFELADVDLSLEPGCVMGFIGPNGAGKSTTIRMIMGLIKADRGDLEVLGVPMPERMADAKWDIGFASEDMRLFKNGTLAWHMNFMRRIYPRWDDNYAQVLLKRFDLRQEQKLKGFSHGQRVKAGLLLALARRPKLLVLDEPTTGLDPVARKEVLNELLEVLADERRAVLFSSHNTQDVEQVSDMITFIDRGRIIDSQDKETFLEKWRRVRFRAADEIREKDLSGVVEFHHRGQLGSVVTDRFEPAMTERLTHLGAEVQGVEPMTLEEIFVAEVEASREEVLL
ncbi:MAG: ABC transporter ATP-binding protein [Pseudomonadota bacterium]